LGSFSYSVSKDGQGFTVPQTQTSYTIDRLSPGQTYSFYVTAVDGALNRSGQSNTVTVTTPEDTTPPTAPELSGSVRGPSQVSLTWTRSTDDITWWTHGYRIFANGAPVTTHVNLYGERSVVLRHLTPATSYTFSVEANDFNGNTMSNEVTLTTEATSDVTPPSAPTNVHIVADQGCGKVWVGWTQSTDDAHPGGFLASSHGPRRRSATIRSTSAPARSASSSPSTSRSSVSSGMQGALPA
jgi:fibronectin type 3 domain-containing protein